MREPEESRERRPPGPGMDRRSRKGIRFKAGPLTFDFSPAAFIACLLFGAVMAMPAGGAGQRPEPAMTLLCAFVVAAILLVHELGHAICLLAHGHSPLLVRFHGPGISETLSQKSIDQPLAWRVLLAGPAANVVAGGLLILCARACGGAFPEGSAVPGWISLFGQYGLAFGFLGLIPIPPLDAGVALLKAIPPSRHRDVHTICAAVSLAALCASLALGSLAGAFLAALFGLRNWRMRQVDLAGKIHMAVQELAPLFKSLEEGWTALGAGRLDEARRKANMCLSEGKGAHLAVGACDLLAWVALAEADPREAEACVERGRRLGGGLYRALTLAMVLDAQGRTLDAITFARAAIASEPSATSYRLTFKLLRKQGFIPEAQELLRSPLWPDKDAVPRLSAELERSFPGQGKGDAGFDVPPGACVPPPSGNPSAPEEAAQCSGEGSGVPDGSQSTDTDDPQWEAGTTASTPPEGQPTETDDPQWEGRRPFDDAGGPKGDERRDQG